MNEAQLDTLAQTAIDTLVQIATSSLADGDTRVRAACEILDRFDKIERYLAASEEEQ